MALHRMGTTYLELSNSNLNISRYNSQYEIPINIGYIGEEKLVVSSGGLNLNDFKVVKT